MPSASGVYSLPVGYLAVTGATIQASQHNPPLEDIAAALTARLSRDGSAPMTGALKALPGTAAAPGYAFSTDASTGLLKTTNGLGISIAGTQVAEFTAAGMASGVWVPGMLIPWTRSIAPPSALWVLPVGQTLSRTTFPTLWTIAQAEIAAGSTFFNNGDGSTTFGIGDLRGRVIAAVDNLGGSTANRLAAGSLASVRHTVGGAGATDTVQLSTPNLPPYTPSGGVAVTQSFGSNGTPLSIFSGGGTAGFSGAGANASGNLYGGAGVTPSGSFTGNAQGGTSSPLSVVQPTMLLSAIMFAGA